MKKENEHSIRRIVNERNSKDCFTCPHAVVFFRFFSRDSSGSGKVNLRQTFECFSFFSRYIFLSPFSAIRHSINVTATDMQKIRLHLFVFFPCFVENSNGRIICLHFVFFYVERRELEVWCGTMAVVPRFLGVRCEQFGK